VTLGQGRITVNREFPNAVPGHVPHIREIWADESAIRIEYVITPHVPHLWLHWAWHAEDDLGNAYAEYGGAYSESPDGQRTEGSSR
jgi:hypothetical protein